MEIEHTSCMAEALLEAKRGWGQCHPNPMVGAVIVEGGEIVARGYHARAGEAHAEVMALRNLGRAPREGAVLYVTLEPCSTKGRTGACTDAILKTAICQVVVGAVDPNPAHQGEGLRLLQAQGVKVVSGVLRDECEDLNLIFNHQIQHQRPFFAAKVATTLDGKIATRTGESKWITGEDARANVMQWRRYFPAIAVGAGTALADDPALTSRCADEVFCPLRFVFDRRLQTVEQLQLKVYSDAFTERTRVITCENVDSQRLKTLDEAGIAYWQLPTASEVTFWDAFETRCSEEGITGIYFEGGMQLLKTLFQQNRIDYLFHYQAPKIIADSEAFSAFSGLSPQSMNEVLQLTEVKRETFGVDQLLRGKLLAD